MRPLFFHLRPKQLPCEVKLPDGSTDTMLLEEPFLPHTYCIKADDKEPNTLYIGYSVVHYKDHFNKAMGRKLAEQRVDSVRNNPSLYMGVPATSKEEFRLHESVQKTLEVITNRAIEILKLQGPVKRVIMMDYKGHKVAVNI
jgi:hypothetical protein